MWAVQKYRLPQEGQPGDVKVKSLTRLSRNAREGFLSGRGKSSKAGGRLCSETLGAWGPPLPLAPREGDPPRTARGQGEGQHPGTGTVAGTEAARHSSGQGRRGEGAQHGFAGRTAPRQSSKTLGLARAHGAQLWPKPPLHA